MYVFFFFFLKIANYSESEYLSKLYNAHSV